LHGHKDRVAGRDKLWRRGGPILGKELGAREHLLLAGPDDLCAGHEALTDGRGKAIDRVVGCQDPAGNGAGGEAACGVDFAHVLKDLSDIHFAGAQRIVLVQDNLNTHTPASLYEAFSPQEARRLVERFEWHYTPKHGSWLDMAESELAILSGQCLSRRIPDRATLEREVAAWVKNRNAHHAKANWRFTAADARIRGFRPLAVERARVSIFTPDRRAIETPLDVDITRVEGRSCGA
jgi:DDE superfamily endonuclease